MSQEEPTQSSSQEALYSELDDICTGSQMNLSSQPQPPIECGGSSSQELKLSQESNPPEIEDNFPGQSEADSGLDIPTIPGVALVTSGNFKQEPGAKQEPNGDISKPAQHSAIELSQSSMSTADTRGDCVQNAGACVDRCCFPAACRFRKLG